MLADTSLMLAVRAAESDVIHADACTANVVSVNYTASTLRSAAVSSVRPPSTGRWVPYVRFAPGKKAIIVVANPDNSTVLDLTLHLDPSSIGLGACTSFVLTDLWPGTARPKIVTPAMLASFSMRVPADMTPRGGLKVMKLVPDS